MTATAELIAALTAHGMDAAEAAGLVARAAVEMTGALTKKSAGAVRQQRYRERNKASQTVTREEATSVTQRNESVTPLRSDEASQTVTKRNESVTSDAGSLSKEEKKENKEEKKKERAEKRATSLPDGWHPDEKHWLESIEVLGSEERARLELRKFQLHAADKGRLAKNWNAAWVKWSLQAVEYGFRNGGGNGPRNTNPRKNGHDAILAAAAREARKIVGDGEMAGPTDEAEFPFGNGPDRGTARGSYGSAGAATPGNDGREPFSDRVLQGEIISPDEADARLPGGWRVIG